MGLTYLFEQIGKSAQGPLSLAARGASRIAKVWQGSEWNCLQNEACAVRRPDDDGEGVSLREMHEKRAQWDASCGIGTDRDCKPLDFSN